MTPFHRARVGHCQAVTLALALAVAFALGLSFTPAGSAVRPEDRERIGRAALVAPSTGEQLVESAVRFAFELPKGATQPMLVISTRSFDPSGWTELPSDPEFTLRDASSPVLSLREAGITLDRNRELWWAVAVRESGTDRLRVSEVRSFSALQSFRNRVVHSPFLSAERTGRLDAGVMARTIEQGGAALEGAAHIRLSAGYDFAPSQGAPAIPAELSRTPVDETSNGLASYLVQFSSAPGPDQMAAIARAGGAVFSYIPDHAYLVRMSPEGRDQLMADGAAWIGAYEPAYKLSPLVDRARAGTRGYLVQAFPDADLAALTAAIAARGVTITGSWDNGINKLVRFEAAGDALPAVARLGGVAWVEPVLEYKLDNSSAQWVVQTNALNNRRVWDMGIRGQGQVVMTSDSGINMAHNQHRDSLVALPGFGDYPTHRKVIAYKLGSVNPGVAFGDHGSFHGTHTGGTIAGSDDPYSIDPRDGMAKAAKIYFMDISGTSLGTGVDAFPDLNDLFMPSLIGNAAGSAYVSSNSWGAPVTGAYTLSSQQCDQFMRNNPNYLINFSNGNAGTSGSVGAPASAKSIGSVGGTGNGASNAIYASTSRGPTADNRRKPTYCAPGNGVSSSTTGTATYSSFAGTSMASPAAAGSITLMRQYLTDGWYPTGAAVPANGFIPSAALLKAMAINAASNTVTGFFAPDNNVGYGKVIADSVLFFAGDARKLLLVDHTGGLGPAEFIEYQVNVTDGSIPLEVSLCWTDEPGNPAGTVQIVNNLNLLVSQGATTYRGNNYSSGFSFAGGVADVRNVEEAVRIQFPAAGIWTVRIESPTVPFGPQPFGLCITGGVSNGAGQLALDRAVYGSSSTVELQVIDTNAGGPSVTVNVASTTETTPEVVTLSGGNGVFSGTLPLSPFAGSSGDGTLAVSNGDGITATYADAAPVANLVANATVNFDTPVISSVLATSQGSLGATITWTTDRPASSSVFYGPTTALGSSVNVPGTRTSHVVNVPGLTTGATYFFDVASATLSGGSAYDDRGGLHYQVTVNNASDILLVYGLPGFERAQAWSDALNANAYSFDVWQGSLADEALLGDVTRGLRSYKAVLWQPGLEQYPAFSDPQRDTITAYLAGGGRLLVDGHDVVWGMADPAAPSYTAARAAWVQSTLKTILDEDPLTWSANLGFAADPISGDYVGGVAYTPFRSGGAGDEITVVPGSGTASYVWQNNESTPGPIGFRWESGTNDGSASTAFWGGLPSRLATMYFEFSAMDPPFTTPSATRADILDKTITWLIGRERPTVAITSPNGGESITSTPTNITWNETVGLGRTIVSRTLEYSLNNGGSWSPLATGVGPSPYSWDLSAVPNAVEARVRIHILDDGAPALGATDASNASCTLARPGGDVLGPIVLAGSIASTPNPIVRPNAATLVAQVTDVSTGGAPVTAAEWSIGAAAAAAGAGTAMSGSFGTPTVNVNALLNTTPFFPGAAKLWVRGQDSTGTWGPATALDLVINGPPPVGVEDELTVAFLGQNAPNPFGTSTTIRFGLPAAGKVELGIYDVTGRRVRALVNESRGAGQHTASWDRRDDRGSPVGPGIYYYRLVAGSQRFDRRMVVLN